MLKGSIYLNVFLVFFVAIIFLIKAFIGKSNLKTLFCLTILYAVYDCLSVGIYMSDIVDIGWDFVILHPVAALSMVFCIIAIVRSGIKIKKSGQAKEKKEENDAGEKRDGGFRLPTCIAVAIAILLPVLIFIFPYFYELNMIKRCDYLLKYNYQRGMIESVDTYFAIVKEKPVQVTLQKYGDGRNGRKVEWQDYRIIFRDGIEISIRDEKYNKVVIENETIKKIAAGAKEKHPSAKGALIEYFPEKGYAMIGLLEKETHGTVLGEYFWHADTYTAIQTEGNLEEVIYYE